MFVEQGEHEVQDLLDEALEVLSSGCGSRLAPGGRGQLGAPASALRSGRVLQVLSNIVGNAIKFTPLGGRISLGVELGVGTSVCFYVRDTGPGIPEAQPAHLRSLLASQGNRQEGRGLGLYIARGIVEAMGGRIWVDSVLGKGATFFFTLPIVPRSEPISEDNLPGDLSELQSGVSWESP